MGTGGRVVVVTGGAGYIGTNLATALLADGQQVRIVDIREPSTAVRHGAVWVRADVRDPAAMRAAMEDASVVYHLAAVISVIGPRGGLVESVNVEGTRTVAEAALACGVGRVVHCSSVHAFDIGSGSGAVIDESSPRAVRRSLPAYDRSKAASEAELRKVVDEGLDAVVINPTGVLGAVDEEPSRIGAVMLALWRRRLPAVVAGGFDWVDVRDVVAALRGAVDRGRTGESYLVPGHRRSMTELADLARACSNVMVTRRCAPAWSARLCAPVATMVARRTHSPLLPTWEALAALKAFPVIDGGKAAWELGHRPRPIEDTVTELYTDFRDRGRLGR
jgi:dihydroflavonol-4-reductase